jgi:hypothetical protein
MKKFMAMYMAPAATIAEMMKATPADMKSGMDEWMKWSDANKKAITDMGAPLGKTKRVTSNGMADTKNEITGYTIVEADSFDAAAKIFKNHPHFKMGKGTTVDLLELVAIPGM